MHADAQIRHGSDESEDAALAAYRRVSVLAVVGLVMGFISASALLQQMLLLVPLVGVAINWLALRKIAAPNSNLSGRWLAHAGLFLCVVFGVASPVETVASRRHLVRSAKPVADLWFATLRNGEPEKALQLRNTAGLRRPLDKNLALYYRTDKTAHEQLEGFVNDELVKTLLLLGDRAQARLYETLDAATDDKRDVLFQVYAVTFDDHGTKTTFFVNITLERSIDYSQQARWRVVATAGGIKPPSMLD